MESRTRVAPSIELSSSGLEIACWAASTARVSPEEVPIPIMAVPACFMMVLTSAKSRLMMPGTVMRSVMPGYLGKDAIGNREGLEHGGLLLGDVEQLVVRDNDHGVDAIGKGLNALFGALLTLAALEGEGLGHDGDGQRTDLVHRDIGNDGSGAGAGATALTAGDEHHVGASERLGDVIAGLIGGLATNLGVAPAPRPRVRSVPMWTLISASEIASA